MTEEAHPLISGKYVIPTAPLRHFHEQIEKWLSKNISGGYAWGLPRHGKTEMAQALDKALASRDGSPIRALFVVATTFMQTDKKFWSEILMAWNISHAPRATAVQIKAMVAATLRECAEENGARTVILTIDEAQKLNRMHFSLLLDLTNLLESAGVRIVVVLVGSILLPKTVKQYFRSELDAQYRSRFFAQAVNVFGLRGVNEVEECLTWYDSSQSPGQRSFTESYLPTAYAGGFRLAGFARAFWTEYLNQFPESQKTGWGMKYFHTSVLVLLNDLSEAGTVSQDDLILAVKHCGQQQPINPKTFDLDLPNAS